MAQLQEAPPSPAPRSGFKKLGFLTLCLLLVGSIGIRAFFVSSATAAPAVPEHATPATDAPPLVANSLVAGEPDLSPPSEPGAAPETTTTQPESEPTGLEKSIPYLTEGSFFALIGFALGYASRKVVKVGLILLALLFVGLQGLSYLEVIQIDWHRAIEVLNNLILNLNENATVTEVLKDRLPTVGALGAGYLLGFRRG